ncbi:ABC transporter permease [Acrocarpospora catenulata]|uniref:ABC transporter permease n=1 Tax=Acrocarpospora catenulata TaxID=2836182 RepID=UPI001BDB2F33|nr:ABC transporter permease [Acrocarpospora catenulata]
MRWALADGWTITRRDLAHWGARPGQFAVTLLFPVLITLMFGYLFGGGLNVPGGDYRSYLMPGMFTMTMLFGLETTFAAVAADARRGITDRFRSLPMASSAVVSGRAAADLLASALTLAVLMACGLAVGWRPEAGPGAAPAAVGLLLWLRFSLLWLGIYLGLRATGPEAVATVQILVWPVAFLSGVLVSPATMPGWLGALAEWNPLSATAAAARELFGNPGWESGSVAAEYGPALAVAWPALLTAVFFPLSVRAFRRLNR